MDIKNTDISFAQLNEQINAWLFDTDEQVHIFKCLVKYITNRDLEVSSHANQIAEVWKKLNIIKFLDKKLHNNICTLDCFIKQITYITDSLEHQIMCHCKNAADFREPIYNTMQCLFLSIAHMKEMLDTIWSDEKSTPQENDDPITKVKYLINKYCYILLSTELKIHEMQKELEKIRNISKEFSCKCTCIF